MTAQTPANDIEMRDVTLQFGDDVGVFDINLNVPRGTIFGLIGPSGSGKTTTVRLMLGLYKPDRGDLSVLGATPTRFPTRVRERIGYMPQKFVLYPNLTVNENLRFVASLYGLHYFRRKPRLRNVLEFVELSDARNRIGGKLSGGMQRRLQLACSLVHAPALLFADEPTAGIDPVLRGKFWEHFRELRSQGRTLFVTTQYVGEAAYCDYVGVMRDGKLLMVETPENLRRRALGGEVLELVVEPGQAATAYGLLERHPGVNRVSHSPQQAGQLYIYVNDAAEALPNIISMLSEHPNITVQRAEEYSPPFDDIFIMLMRKAESANVA